MQKKEQARYIGFECPATLYDKIKRAAGKDRRSLSNFIVLTLEKSQNGTTQ